MAKGVAEEYSSSLSDLTVNSKPLINMLTMLAEDYLEHAPTIVRTVEAHLQKVRGDIKLPVLYLIDSIVKNVGKDYVSLFTQNIVSTFCSVFEQVDEKVRSQMFKLRQTWNEVFPAKKLYALDARVNSIDPAWPITAPTPHGRIHVNPKFLTPTPSNPSTVNQNPPTAANSLSSTPPIVDGSVREELLKKQKELLELQKRKVELELLQTKAILEEQQKKLENQTASFKGDNATSVGNQKLKSVVQQEVPDVNLLTSRHNDNKQEKAKLEIFKGRDPRLRTKKISKRSDTENNHVPIEDSVSRSQQIKDVAEASFIENGKEKKHNSSGSSKSFKRRGEKRFKKYKESRPKTKSVSKDSYDISGPTAGDDKTKNKKQSEVPVHGLDSSVLNEPPSVRDDNVKNKSNIEFGTNINFRKSDKDNTSKSKSKTKVIECLDARNVENMELDLHSDISAEIPIIVDKIDDSLPSSTGDDMIFENESLNKPIQEVDMVQDNMKSPETSPKLTRSYETPICILESPHQEVSLDTGRDIDLRLLPQSKADSEQPPEKKTQAEMQTLFGEEDVDLRKLPPPPPTPPPPPIISNTDFANDVELNRGWANIKRSNSDSCGKSAKKMKPLSSPRSTAFNIRSDADENCLKMDDQESEERDQSFYYIMKQAEEQLKNGTITFSQYNQMLKGVMSLNEESKLQEAIMKDELERVDSPGSVSNSSDISIHSISSPPQEKEKGTFSSELEGNFKEKIGASDNMTEMESMLETYDSRDDGDLLNDNGYHMKSRKRSSKNQEKFQRSGKDTRQRYFNQVDQPFVSSNNNKPWGIRPTHPTFVPHPPRKDVGPFRWPTQNYHVPRAVFDPKKTSFGHPSRMRVPRHHQEVSLPPADPTVLELIKSDPMTHVNVGGVPKEVRFYGENAIIMLDWDDPRDLMFQPGTRRVFIDGVDILTLQFNSQYREITLNDGLRIRIRLGAPTRELFIDGRFYDVKFGGPPIEINLGGRTHRIQLDGPLPYLKIGPARRTDLVAGKVNLIVDANIENIFPIYLDAKPQRFEIGTVSFIIRFVEALQTVVINGQPFKIQFGGIPIPIFFLGERHFLRLTSLPSGIVPGYVNILNMEGGRLPTTPPPPMPPRTPTPPQINDAYSPSVSSGFINQALSADVMRPMTSNTAPYFNTNADYQNYSVSSGIELPVDVLASLMPSSTNGHPLQNYVVEAYQETTTSASDAPVSNINVSELYQKLVAIGVVPPMKEKEKSEDKLAIKPVDFSKPETLKVKQYGLINKLYSGIQCSSCGIRFSPEQTVKYSQHLDWHFRQNRRERYSSKIAQSRRWNYDVSDWIQYQEIEDLEERAQSWFEIQDKKGSGAIDEEEDKEESSVPAKGYGENPCCTVCRDKFDQFFNEEKEEWQLKRAIIMDDKLYHPLCYKDEQESEGRTLGPLLLTPPEESEPIETIDLDDLTPTESCQDDKDKEKTEENEKDVEIIEESPEENTSSEVIVEENKSDDAIIDENIETISEEHKENDEENIKETAPPIEEDSDDDILEIEVLKPVIESYEILDDDDDDDDENHNEAEINEKEDEEDDNFEMSEVDRNDDGNEISISDNEINENEPVVIKTEKMDVNTNIGVNTSHINETISLDGNSQFTPPTIVMPKRIKINISSILNKNMNDDTSQESVVAEQGTSDQITTESSPTFDYQEPLPPGEEMYPVQMKTGLVGTRFHEIAPVSKGKELSGLCSIM